MDIRRLRLITIVGPVAFLIALELLGIFVLRPTLGGNSVLRLVVVFAILTVAVIPFAFWVFDTIGHQQEELELRISELDAANIVIATHNKQLDAVNTALSSISSAIHLGQVLQNITDAARTLIRCKYAALGVAGADGTLEAFITSGITPEQRAALGPVPTGHGLIGVLIKEGKPLRIADIANDPRRHGFPPNHPPMKSLLGVPIVFKGKTVGDLYLTERLDGEQFSEEDQELLVLLASHAAVAIENARLYEDARTARDRLQSWNEQLEAIVAERTREIERYSKEMTTRVLQAQEEERKRIARELHDETAQSLSTLLITMDLYEPRLPPDDPVLRQGFERMRELARRTLDETRALSHDLRPTILDDVGLIAALQWYADEHFKTYRVPVEVRAQPAPEEGLPPEVEITLFRIAQEALTNSGKYAEATRARVTLSFEDGMATLMIEDNGKGFDPAKTSGPTRSGGLGLYGMRERAVLLDGTLTIESCPGEDRRGTRVAARVPVAGAEDIAVEQQALAGYEPAME
ncbi:MAG TPA: GAF domain-containing sensor histidine kinase [Chloroflexota bacterium]|nr:GAF domain-containing sensor histidine kinase [Chloroflexota bacterium]